MARDNFTKAVIEKLRTRVTNRCSNPDCRVPTTGPSIDQNKATIIGIAAHITAAAIGGPRYDPTLTDKARKSMANGIWLCSNCSIKIDKDVVRYPVGLLRQWKETSEELAKQELGKKLPNKNDAIDTLTTALTGHPKKFLPEAISNIHKASTNMLESLDPRFAVLSTYTEGKTQFEILAKQNVSILMNIKKEYVQEYSDKFRQLIEHGIDLTINGGAISFEGSKLFEEISENIASGTLVFSPQKKKATQKLWLINRETSLVENFDDIPGVISTGSQSISFVGTACNDIFLYNYKMSPNGESNSMNGNIAVHFGKWAGLDVRELPYFKKIHSLFSKILAGWDCFTSLEISGSEIYRSNELPLNKSNFVSGVSQILNTIEMARILADSLNIKITFDPNFTFTVDEYNKFREAVRIVEGKSVYREDDLDSNIKSDFIVEENENRIELLQQCTEPINIVYVERHGSELQLFGQNVVLPKRIWRVFAVKPYISSSINVVNLTTGDLVDIEWIPADGFEARVEFENPENPEKPIEPWK